MTIPLGLQHLLRQPENINILFFKKDKTLPFAVRASLINAYRRHVQEHPGPVQVARPVRKAKVDIVKDRREKVKKAKGTGKNWFRTTALVIWNSFHSRGKGKVVKKRKKYCKTVSSVRHLTGTKGLWREQCPT